MRKVDIVARYGGEEFVAILPGDVAATAASSSPSACASASRDIHSTSAGRSRVHLTVSIGVATFPSPRVDSTEDLFARADEALYRAKSGGRNQVRT